VASLIPASQSGKEASASIAKVQQERPQRLLGRDQRPADVGIKLVELQRQSSELLVDDRPDRPQRVVQRRPRLAAQAAQAAELAIGPNIATPALSHPTADIRTDQSYQISPRRPPTFRILFSGSRSSPWAGRRISSMRCSWGQVAQRLAGDGVPRRGLSKLSCAGWLPHNRGVRLGAASL
jgi:hypothetical protein